MVSFGPQIEAPHSPDERVSIPTVERFWRLLAGVVDELSSARATTVSPRPALSSRGASLSWHRRTGGRRCPDRDARESDRSLAPSTIAKRGGTAGRVSNSGTARKEGPCHKALVTLPE
jgi:hypothetical protein